MLRRLRAAGLPAALGLLAACAGNRAAGGPFPQLQQYEGREVERVHFEGEIVVPRDTLGRVVTTRATQCQFLGLIPFIKLCPFGFGKKEYYLDLGVLARDVVRIGVLHRDFGYYGTRVRPSVQESGEEQVEVRFFITPGDLVTLTRLSVEGTEGIIPEEELLRRIPLKQGEPFRRMDFLASVDTVRNALLDRGHAYAQVLRNFDIDTIADVAQAELTASPGPVVTVDTILFAGLYRLTERTARKQLALREGQRLRARDLSTSQANLFDLELVDFAAVEVAPESLQVTPDSAELLEDSIGSTVVVRVTEAPRYAVDVSAGYGTVDCLRARGSHVDRNFLGGARRLELSGLVAKVGATGSFNGLAETPACSAFELDDESPPIDEAITRAIDYRLAADFVQPRLFGTRTSFLASAYTERISELGLYLREARGAQVGAVRQIARGTVASATVNAERGRTDASDFFFCRALEVCDREDIDRLKDPRWTNSLALSLVRNRVRLNPFPTGGYQARVTTDYADKLLGSDDRYLRGQADGTMYRQVGRGWVVQGRLMGGTFLEGIVDFGEVDFVPPERRFYGGGPTSVRGYPRNQLGPRVYIRRPRPRDDPGDPLEFDTVSSATGGTRTFLATVEATTPTFLRILRGAFFVDAGQVWSPPGDDEDLLTSPGIRFTPGVGLRFATPVGPFRLDAAYRPYPPERGPLYEIDEDGNLSAVPIDTDFREPESTKPLRKMLDRITLQISIGQAF